MIETDETGQIIVTDADQPKPAHDPAKDNAKENAQDDQPQTEAGVKTDAAADTDDAALDTRSAQERIDDEVGFAVLVQGEIKGEPFWAYLSVFPSQYDAFVEVQKTDEPYRLTDYGDILEYKIGEESPSAEIMKAMEEKYGVDHGFESKIVEIAQSSGLVSLPALKP